MRGLTLADLQAASAAAGTSSVSINTAADAAGTPPDAAVGLLVEGLLRAACGTAAAGAVDAHPGLR